MDAPPGHFAPVTALAVALHGTLLELDPARFVAERAGALHTALRNTSDALRQQGASDDEVGTAARALASALDAPPPADEHDIATWVAFRIAVGPAYENLVAGLARAGERVPSLRPTNYARSIFHVCSGLLALTVIELWTEGVLWMAGGFLTSAVLMESSRRVSPRANEVLMGAFGKVAHPYERHRVNSASWYALALMLLALFVPPVGCAIGVVVLAFGDPMAAIIGRRFGRTKLPGGRTLEGSLAFVAGRQPGSAHPNEVISSVDFDPSGAEAWTAGVALEIPVFEWTARRSRGCGCSTWRMISSRCSRVRANRAAPMCSMPPPAAW